MNYGARYRKGLPISSSIAESAVNQVVSRRVAKKRVATPYHGLVQAPSSGQLTCRHNLGETQMRSPQTLHQ